MSEPIPLAVVDASEADGDAVQALRRRIDQTLAELLPAPVDAHDLVAAAMQDGVLAPGKRLRPLLMLLVGQSLGGPGCALLHLACAVEMVHAASLFLDDMPCMDNARLRRGRLAVHARFGEDVAMLGAVALLSQASATVASAPGLDPSRQAQLVRVLCDAIGVNGLVRGQYRDLREGAAQRQASEVASANYQKTGALFAAALEMAAIASEAPQHTAGLLRQAASHIGHAFQLKDDLEDGEHLVAPLTKDRHQDAGKSTLVSLLGHEAVRVLLDDHVAQAEEAMRKALPRDTAALALVRKSLSSSRRVHPEETSAPKLRLL